MSTGEDHMALFDAYLMDELSGQEKADFEHRLKADEAFKTAFDAYKQEVSMIRSLGIRQEMADIMAEVGKAKPRNLRFWLPVGIAAALALVLLAWPNKSPGPDELFDRHFEAYPNAISGRATPGSVDKALDLYDQRRYVEALEAMETLTPSDTVALYGAICQLALGNQKAALNKLREVTQRSVFYEAAVWYQGLGFLLADEPDSSRYYLEKVKTNDPNYKAAQEILKHLK